MIKNHKRRNNLKTLKLEKKWMKLYEKYFNKNKQIKIITLVCEPISRNISAFFENNKNYDKPVQNLFDEFIRNYSHDVPLNWFDDEFKQVTGIDVFEHPFPYHKKCQIYKNGRISVLLIRVDILDSEIEGQIQMFLDLDKFRLKNKNIGKNKKYSQKYRNFISEISLSPNYVNKMLSSNYTKHFLEESEINIIKNKWLSDS